MQSGSKLQSTPMRTPLRTPLRSTLTESSPRRSASKSISSPLHSNRSKLQLEYKLPIAPGRDKWIELDNMLKDEFLQKKFVSIHLFYLLYVIIEVF